MKILISGASRGLGRDIAIRLAQLGHELILVARSTKALEDLQKDLSSQTKVNIVVADLSQTALLPAAFKQYSGKDTPDVIINNVGGYEVGAASELSIEKVEKQLRLNLFGSIALTNCFIDEFKQRKNGLIVNICSVASISAVPSAAAYSISKQGLKAWGDALREEMRAHQVKVTNFFPSSINSSSWDGAADESRAKMIQGSDIAELITALLLIGKSTLVEEIRLSPLQDIYG